MLCGLALEIGLRVFSPVPPSWLAIYSEHPRLPYSLMPGAERAVHTGVTDWSVQTDVGRLRIGRDGSVPADQPHWLVIGDSFAFGHGVDAEQGLVGRLAVETGMAIANAAVPGYGPEQYRAMLAEHIDRPGLSGVLVFAYLGNDIHDATWDKTVTIHDGILGLQPGLKGAIKRRSHAYRFVSNTLHRLGVGGRDTSLDIEAELMDPNAWFGPLKEAEAIWMTAYGEMRDACAERGVPVVVILLPNRSAVDSVIRERAVERSAGDVASLDAMLALAHARAWVTAVGLPLLDATETLQSLGGERFLEFDGHFTARTNAAVANALAPQIMAVLTGADQ